MAASATEPCVACHKDLSVLGTSHPPVANTKMSECFACHESMKKPMSYKLHVAHADKTSCDSCHTLKDEKLLVKPNAKELGALMESDWELYTELFDGLPNQQNSAKQHLEKGLQCQDCHDVGTPAEMSTVKNTKCESCHGKIEEIAAKTAPAMKEQNPHKSHQGELSCNKCHSGHGQAQSYCLECHSNFQQTMPEKQIK